MIQRQSQKTIRTATYSRSAPGRAGAGGWATAISRKQRHPQPQPHTDGRLPGIISVERERERERERAAFWSLDLAPSLPLSFLPRFGRSLSVMSPFFKAHPFFGQSKGRGASQPARSASGFSFLPSGHETTATAAAPSPTFSLFVAPPPHSGWQSCVDR